MAETRRLSQLVDSVSSRVQLPEGDLVVALSGGADSATLSYLCALRGRRVRAFHVNHGLVGSPLMEKAARAIAETLGLVLNVAKVEVPAGPSPEGQARRARYAAFAESTGPGEALLTGHTRDDDAETVLMNVIRGTGTRGLAGIPYHRTPNIYRPILGVDRSETREIAALADLEFLDDPMNEDPGLTRNLLRRQIIPSLSQLNPRIAASLTRVGSAVAADNAHFEEITPYDAIYFSDGVAAAPVGVLETVERAVSDRMLMRMLGLVAGASAVTADRVERMRSVLTAGSAGQELGAGTVARRRGPMLIIGPISDRAPQEPLKLLPGAHRFGSLEFEVVEVSGPCRVIPLSRWCAVFAKETDLEVGQDGVVMANGEPAWVPGTKRYPVAWYVPGSIGYVSVCAREATG